MANYVQCFELVEERWTNLQNKPNLQYLQYYLLNFHPFGIIEINTFNFEKVKKQRDENVRHFKMKLLDSVWDLDGKDKKKKKTFTLMVLALCH